MSAEAIRSYARLSPERKLDWIEEMIRFEASLPARVRRAHERHRALARKPAR